MVALREGGVDRNSPSEPSRRASLSRPPRGGRGSQQGSAPAMTSPTQSPSARGAWIATLLPKRSRTASRGSPSARGAWIATRSTPRRVRLSRRPPRGRRGSQRSEQVHFAGADVALREGGVDRNVFDPATGGFVATSPSARGAWIATPSVARKSFWRCRPPRGGRGSQPCAREFAPRFQGRPPRGGRGSQLVRGGRQHERAVSPSARGAWIATSWSRAWGCRSTVALREGGVDRNIGTRRQAPAPGASPSARGAWIAT